MVEGRGEGRGCLDSMAPPAVLFTSEEKLSKLIKASQSVSQPDSSTAVLQESRFSFEGEDYRDYTILWSKLFDEQNCDKNNIMQYC